MALPIRLPQLGRRTRAILRYVGLVLLALVTFLFAFQATIPIDRIAEKLEELAAPKAELSIGKARRGIMPGTIYLENVWLKTHPKQEDLDKAYTIQDPKERDKAVAQLVSSLYFDEIKVSVGIFAAIRGTIAADIEAQIADGTLHGTVSFNKDGTNVHMTGEDLPSQQLPMREVLSNLPMSGAINLEISLDLPNEKLKTGKIGPNWQRADGELDFECPSGCVIGDGKSKLKFKLKNARQAAFAGEGTDFGSVRIQSMVARAELKDGKLDLTKFETKSDDIQLFVDFSMTIAPELNDSAVAGCVRFRGTEALRKREPRTFDQFALTGAFRAPDGLDHIHLTQTFKNIGKKPEQCGPGAPSDSNKPSLPSGPTAPNRRDDAPQVTIPPPQMPPPPPPTAIPAPPENGGIVPPPQDQPVQPLPPTGMEGSGAGSGTVYPPYPGSGAQQPGSGAYPQPYPPQGE
jgi:type II secretion system protein N